MDHLRDFMMRAARESVSKRDSAVREQLRGLAGGDAVVFHPDDWVLLFDSPRGSHSDVEQVDGKLRVTITQRVPLLCPKSLYEESLLPEGQRSRWHEFLRTRKIPSDCPELRRICSIRNVGE